MQCTHGFKCNFVNDSLTRVHSPKTFHMNMEHFSLSLAHFLQSLLQFYFHLCILFFSKTKLIFVVVYLCCVNRQPQYQYFKNGINFTESFVRVLLSKCDKKFVVWQGFMSPKCQHLLSHFIESLCKKNLNDKICKNFSMKWQNMQGTKIISSAIFINLFLCKSKWKMSCIFHVNLL